MTRNTLRIQIMMLVLMIFGTASLGLAQDRIALSGTIFSDYYYLVASPVHSDEGLNAFEFRRVRLTSDFVLSDRFSGRLRFEGSEGQTTEQGVPSAYVKDAWLRWNDVFGEGHRITFGLFRPPMWGVVEDHWGYRSLAKTIQDRVKIAQSRDAGIQVTGPVSDVLSYAIMIGNNAGGRQETNKYKRAYGQVVFRPDDKLQVTAGTDYYEFGTGSSWNVNGFVGYSVDQARIGIEGFYNPISHDDQDEDTIRYGISLFGNYDVSDSRRLILRVDRNTLDDRLVDTSSNWAALGVAFLVEDNLQIIPNVIYEKQIDEDDAFLMARLTLWATF